MGTKGDTSRIYLVRREDFINGEISLVEVELEIFVRAHKNVTYVELSFEVYKTFK